eukprot:3997158-Pleurochrysis_carterae.AAC.6
MEIICSLCSKCLAPRSYEAQWVRCRPTAISLSVELSGIHTYRASFSSIWLLGHQTDVRVL